VVAGIQCLQYLLLHINFHKFADAKSRVSKGRRKIIKMDGLCILRPLSLKVLIKLGMEEREGRGDAEWRVRLLESRWK
jgi:hypothetical protein